VGGEFNAEYESFIKGELDDNPSDPKSEFFGYTHTDDLSSSTATIHLNPKNLCSGGSCSLLEGGFASGAKTVPLAALMPGSMKGHSSYLWNQNLTSMSQANLNSPGVVWNVSMFLAEPAVAQGQHNAAMLAAAMSQAGYLEHIGFNAMAENVQGAKPALEAYNWCLHNALKAGKGLAKARIICGRDNGDTPALASAPLTGTEAPGGVPLGFQYLDLPAKNPTTGALGISPTNNDPRVVRLSDIIFNEEATAASTGGNPAATIAGAKLITFKEAFKELYGDIEFKSNPLAANLGMVIEQEYETIKPTTAADQAYRQIIVYKFNALRHVVFKHCNEMQSPTLNSSEDLQVNSFGPLAWVNQIDMADIKALSIPGFTMNGAGIVGLRNWYRDAFYVPGAIGGLGGSVNCDPLNNNGDYMVGFPVTGAVPPLFNPFDTFNNQLDRIAGREFFVMLYNTAKLLALGEWLTKAALAEQLLNNLSSGMQQGQVFADMARTLVYKAAGTTDIRGSLDRTAQQLKQSFLRVYERQDSAGESAAQKGSQISR
jgi:hypothetical protein